MISGLENPALVNSVAVTLSAIKSILCFPVRRPLSPLDSPFSIPVNFLGRPKKQPTSFTKNLGVSGALDMARRGFAYRVP